MTTSVVANKQDFVCDMQQPLQDKLQKLYEIRDNHKIWKNPLLLDCMAGKLTFSDFQFLFSQYYLYNKNFTRYLAALMFHCENDLYRSRLSQNLWEEGGGLEVEKRHTEIFRQFLEKSLKIDFLEDLVFEPFSENFFNTYLHLCLNGSTLEVAAVLSLGTEGIISRLYTIMKKGLKSIGLSENELLFFSLHIECDDDHAETIEDIVLSYSHCFDWFEVCKGGMIKALDARDLFFTQAYCALHMKRLSEVVNHVCFVPDGEESEKAIPTLVFNTRVTDKLLYKNYDPNININFNVHRFPIKGDILDPRLVKIPPRYTNELHRHAHETVFLILEGEGEVILDKEILPVKTGDIVFVPRWVLHQTRNTGNSELIFFAVTDYGFTKCFSGNTETSYRKSTKSSF